VRLSLTRLGAPAVLYLAATSANAGLMGSQVTAEWIVEPYFHTTDTFVVTPGIEVNVWAGSPNYPKYLDVGDNSIHVHFSQIYSLGEGTVWKFTGSQFAGFSGVSVFSTGSGFDTSWLALSAAGLTVTFPIEYIFPAAEAGDIVFNLIPSAVPEPDESAMLLAGLACLGVWCRNRPGRKGT
jgi:hypothetical protein